MTGDGPRWEYRTVDGLDPALDLDLLGREGWELAAAAAGTGGEGRVLYFKRPAPDLRERVTLDQKRRVYAAMGLALPDVEGPQA